MLLGIANREYAERLREIDASQYDHVQTMTAAAEAPRRTRDEPEQSPAGRAR